MNGDDYVEETCAKYYPTAQGAAIHTNNGVEVTLLKLGTIQHITKRVLRLRSDALSRPWTVTQFQLQSWKMYDQVHASSPMGVTKGKVKVKVNVDLYSASP